MTKGFIPEGDKLHTMQPQQPGVFIAVTENGVFLEVVVLMETQQVMVREWEKLPWDDEAVKTEMQRVTARMQQAQQAQQQMQIPQQAGGRPPMPGQIIRPGTARPGTI